MKKYIIITLIAIAPFAGKAQIDFGSFLEAGTADAEKLMEGYLEPVFLGLGYGINSGWYNTAKPHKLLGFDITPTVTFANVPDAGQFFTIDNSEYTNLRVVPTIEGELITQAPTLLGPNLPNERLPFLEYTADDGTSVRISAPTGLGMDEVLPFNAMPSAMVQVGVGLVKGTELKLRIVPASVTEGVDEASFEMFGIGIMHDLKQWVPGFKQLPIDVSGFVGWNRMTAQFFLDPDGAPDQVAQFTTGGFTMQGLISKKIAFITLFSGIGIANTRTTFDLLGRYETENAGTFTNPISFDYASTSPRINVGFRMKLLILTIHADYAIQKYSTLTTGVGISIR